MHVIDPKSDDVISQWKLKDRYIVRKNLDCFNSFLASDNFYHLLIAFANNLDPDHKGFSTLSLSGPLKTCSMFFNGLLLEGPPIPITIDMVKKIISKMKLDKAHVQKYLAVNKRLYMAFVDLEKAFGNVPQNVI